MNAGDTIQAARLMLEWAQAMEAGKPFELQVRYRNGQGWFECSAQPDWNWQTAVYRRKPEPKLVPLGPEDVPPGTTIRFGCSVGWEAITKVFDTGIIVGGELRLNFKDLAKADDAKINRNDGKGWVFCSKELA